MRLRTTLAALITTLLLACPETPVTPGTDGGHGYDATRVDATVGDVTLLDVVGSDSALPQDAASGVDHVVDTPDPNRSDNNLRDSDCDGLNDAEEYGNVYGGGGQTNPGNPDSDGDGILDGVEVGRTASVDARCTMFVADQDPTAVTDPTRADTDGDGLSDGQEDLDRDGRHDPGELDPRDPDTDDDGLCDGPTTVAPICTGGDPDPYSAVQDTDQDGVPDSLDSAPSNPDRDGDGLCDGARSVAGVCQGGEDLNGDGIVGSGESNPDRADSDCDGLGDLAEDQLGTNPRKRDTDGDLIPDGIEAGITQNPDPQCTSFVADADPATGTDPLAIDSDGDGINDGIEDLNRNGRVDAGETDPNDPDTDGDGACDGPPRTLAGVCSGGEDVNANGQVDPGESDPRVAGTVQTDSDGDGLSDEVENLVACLDAQSTDSDGDGLQDGVEDASHNGRVDPGESDPCDTDSDCDGLVDGASYGAFTGEATAGTSRTNPDTDGDGLGDGLEVGVTGSAIPAGTDGSCGFVADADPLSNTNPTVADSDGDGVPDGAEDQNQNGRVDCADGSAPPGGNLANCPGGRTELNPNVGTDITGTVTNACAQPRAPTLHGQQITDLLLATAPGFAAASTTDITNASGDVVGVAMVDTTNQLTAFALRKAPEGANPAAEINTIAGRIGSITVPLEQSFTTWDGYPSARGTYTYGNTQSITDRTTRAVRQALNDAAATVSLTGAPAVNGPFKLGLQVVHRSASTAIVVGVLQQLPAYEAADFRHDDVMNGSALAQVGDTVGLQCDRFASSASQKVDFIWVVDDSGSMADAQDAVSAAADEMVAQLNNSTLDWRIAIITTYYYSTQTSLSSFGGTYCDFVTTATAFRTCLNNVQSSSRGTEAGFQSLDAALDGRFLPAQAGSASRIRPDARVVAIFLSDAGDQSSTQSVTTWTTFFQGGAGGGSWDPGRSDEAPMILGGILCPRGISCSGESDSTGGGAEHEQYYQVIQNLGGVTGSISQPDGSNSASDADIQASVQGIMTTVIGLATPYELTKAPISATLKVALQGPVEDVGNCNLADLPRSRVNGFSYDGASRALAFHGACRPTTIGTEIAASYYYWTDRTPDPDGGGEACDCSPPEVCDPLTLECYCPPDCGVGTLPPEQVCDTATCEIVCRPDCGGSCAGNSVCNPSPSVCACECPSDCGGASPGGNFVCDRAPASPTFCEYVCSQCPGTPANASMTCDPGTCTWTCPDCGDCPGLSTCSEQTCACSCSQSLSCSAGYRWDQSACDCVCDVDGLDCGPNYLPDGGLCACICGSNCNDQCVGNLRCQQSLCACIPIGG